MSEGKQYACSECGKAYKQNSHLRRHVSQAHPEKLEVIAPMLNAKKSYRHTCELCNKKFNHIHHLRYHVRQVHGNGHGEKLAKMKCSLCEFLASNRKYLLDHLETQHKVLIKSEEVEFDSFEDFLDWKQQIESNTVSKYVKEYTFHSTVSGVMNSSYKCHRSGLYASKGKGIRNLKRQGSVKIGGACPASMKVVEAEGGKCKVTFISTHVGHDNDMKYLSLTESERFCLAGDIAQNIPYDEILNKVRDIAANSKLERIHLVTKKDLYNIAQANNLCPDFMRHITDEGIVEHVIIDETNDEQFLHIKRENEEEVMVEGKLVIDETGHKLLIHEEETEGDVFVQTKLIKQENSEQSDLDQQQGKVKQIFMEVSDSTSSPIQLKVLKRQLSSLGETLKAVSSTCDHRPVNSYKTPSMKKRLNSKVTGSMTKKLSESCSPLGKKSDMLSICAGTR